MYFDKMVFNGIIYCIEKVFMLLVGIIVDVLIKDGFFNIFFVVVNVVGFVEVLKGKFYDK